MRAHHILQLPQALECFRMLLLDLHALQLTKDSSSGVTLCQSDLYQYSMLFWFLSEIGDSGFVVHYELETAINLKGEHVVAFLLFSYKRLCTVAFGYVVRIGLVW